MESQPESWEERRLYMLDTLLMEPPRLARRLFDVVRAARFRLTREIYSESYTCVGWEGVRLTQNPDEMLAQRASLALGQPLQENEKRLIYSRHALKISHYLDSFRYWFFALMPQEEYMAWHERLEVVIAKCEECEDRTPERVIEEIVSQGEVLLERLNEIYRARSG